MLAALLGAGAWAAGSAPAAPGGPVEVVQVDGPIDRITGRFLLDRIQAAPREGAQVVVVTVSSAASYGFDPAPLVAATAASPVPVVAWVGGKGAVAAGAAAQFVAATSLVAAAPGARIAAPVTVQLIAPDVGDVVVGLDGRDLKGVHLSTAAQVVGADGRPRRQPSVPVRFFKPGFLPRLLHSVASPHIALFLLLAGSAAVAFELFTSGVGLAGLTGALCLVLSFSGLAALPTRWPGVVMVSLATVAFGVDAQNLRIGGWTVAGAVLMGAGMVGAFWGAPAGFRLSWWPTLLVAGLALVLWLVAIPVMVRSRYSAPQVRRERLVGQDGRTETRIDPVGLVRLRGAAWPAAARGSPIGEGQAVEVVRVDGVRLVVERPGEE